MASVMAKLVAVLCVALLVAHADSARTLKESIEATVESLGTDTIFATEVVPDSDVGAPEQAQEFEATPEFPYVDNGDVGVQDVDAFADVEKVSEVDPTDSTPFSSLDVDSFMTNPDTSYPEFATAGESELPPFYSDSFAVESDVNNQFADAGNFDFSPDGSGYASSWDSP